MENEIVLNNDEKVKYDYIISCLGSVKQKYLLHQKMYFYLKKIITQKNNFSSK